ncbi:hypothetical protein U91I_02210 [alpha proteobacterium U9-1i]|nr:hypothetical protein U91I_02210 [alpha proteobacterium U9-1i]
MGHVYVQSVGDLVQPTGGDTVDALFVLLNLLERYADQLSEMFLAHSDVEPALTHLVSYVGVYGVRRALLCHCATLRSRFVTLPIDIAPCRNATSQCAVLNQVPARSE